ncbi:MAG TPA: hypothetical protein VLS45_09385 [Methylomicrobium sp.]|nr:hypothetical protein [Methylomicrobium sp.]
MTAVFSVLCCSSEEIDRQPITAISVVVRHLPDAGRRHREDQRSSAWTQALSRFTRRLGVCHGVTWRRSAASVFFGFAPVRTTYGPYCFTRDQRTSHVSRRRERSATGAIRFARTTESASIYGHPPDWDSHVIRRRTDGRRRVRLASAPGQPGYAALRCELRAAVCATDL